MAVAPPPYDSLTSEGSLRPVSSDVSSLSYQFSGMDIQQSVTRAGDTALLSMFTQGNVIELQSRSSGQLLRIVSGDVDGRGAKGAHSSFIVHVRRLGVVALQSAANSTDWLVLYQGKTSGMGQGGPYSEFLVREIDEKLVTLESTLLPGQFLSICSDGSVNPPEQSSLSQANNSFLPLVIHSNPIQASTLPRPQTQSFSTPPMAASIPAAQPSPYPNQQQPPPQYPQYPHQPPPQQPHPYAQQGQPYPHPAPYPSAYPRHPPPQPASYPYQSPPPMSQGYPRPTYQRSLTYTAGFPVAAPGPGGYQQPAMRQQRHSYPSVTFTGPAAPIGYNIMDLLTTGNVIQIIPTSDPERYPIKAHSKYLQRGDYIHDDSLFTVVNIEPGTIALRNVHWTAFHIVVNMKRKIRANGKAGESTTHFIVHPKSGGAIALESVVHRGFYLGFDAYCKPQLITYTESDNQTILIIRLQKHVTPYSNPLMTPFGRPSVVNQLEDRGTVQLFSKRLGVYLRISNHGTVKSTRDSQDISTLLIFHDRGMGVVSFQSQNLLKYRIRVLDNQVQGMGEANMNGDFFFKECANGSVCLESVTNPGFLLPIILKENKKSAPVSDHNITIFKVTLAQQKGRTTISQIPLHV